MALHMYYLVRCVWYFLANKFGNRFFTVVEYIMKTEYQGRGTPHWHIAAWVLPHGLLGRLVGRTKDKRAVRAAGSVLLKFLELIFQCDIDVNVGCGSCNYITGYVAKDHDAVDVGLGEYVQKNQTSSWLAAYRLLCQSSPCIPECAIRMASLPEFDRSYANVLLYPPQPAAMVSLEGRRTNFSTRMYGMYLQEMRQLVNVAGKPMCESFLVWHRSRDEDPKTHNVVLRGRHHQTHHAKTFVVACRYWYELTDGYWGQLVLTQIPHLEAKDLLPRGGRHLACMENFVGMLEYLVSWRWGASIGDAKVIKAASGAVFYASSLPLILNDEGCVEHLSTSVEDEAVFPTERAAFEYLVTFAKHDLQMRGFRGERTCAFVEKQKANMLLHERVRRCRSDEEFERWRQHWDHINRPKLRTLRWGVKQQEVLDIVSRELSCEDEDVKKRSRRQLYVEGPPGSGKSAVLLECALIAVRAGQRVLIVCPTGALVYSFKSLLPDVEGIENIQVDTIHGLLKYKRPGEDTEHKSNAWAPPSALRRIDLILVDEGSQYDDKEWIRFYQSVKEQPHRPMVVVVADFQQLQPVNAAVSQRLCQRWCESQEKVRLDTVYRSSDPEHLVFLNEIRNGQPDRSTLREYFGDRIWHRRDSLDVAVGRGMKIAEETGKPFSWLTSTNRGAAEVCEAALRVLQVTPEEVAEGFQCDYEHSHLRIVAKRGILIRLTRNLDKQRGFVNGALATVWEQLDGSRCFIARLCTSGNLVLVHPLREMDKKRSVMMTFLPCVYGYATTIRRAQGASLDQGCLYFDQTNCGKKHPGRGYGYVGASRFRSREGCYLYGRIRRTDFLPVGDERESDVMERGTLSESTEEEDGPQFCWRNPLAGGMRCYDEDGESASSSEAESGDVCGVDVREGVQDDIDFF